MRALSQKEMDQVSGGCFLFSFLFCQPKVTTCAPKPTCTPKPVCEPKPVCAPKPSCNPKPSCDPKPTCPPVEIPL